MPFSVRRMACLFILLCSGCGKDGPQTRGEVNSRQYEVLSQDAILASSIEEFGKTTVLNLYLSEDFAFAGETPSLSIAHLPSNESAPLKIQVATQRKVDSVVSVKDMNFGEIQIKGPLVEWRLILEDAKKERLLTRFSPDSTLVENLALLQVHYSGFTLERWILPLENLRFESMSLNSLNGVSATNHGRTVNIGILHMGKLAKVEQGRLLEILGELRKFWKDQCDIDVEFSAVEHFSELRNVPQLPIRAAVGPDLLGVVSKYVDPSASVDILVLSRWLLWSTGRERIKGAEMKWSELSLKSYESKPNAHLQSVVLVENLADSAVISHEIGHALMGPGHDQDPGNLMFSRPTELSLRPDQCEAARAKVAKSF